MNKKILVTYASRTGWTVGVAEAIGKTLKEKGVQVDVIPMRDVKDLSVYQAVVAGSSINATAWMPEAMQFIRAQQRELTQKPFAAFLVCITLSMENGKYRQGVAEWLEPVRALVKPASEGLFAGALDFSKLPLTPNTLLMRLPVIFGLWRVGDHRDWDAIRTWALSLRPLLLPRE